MTYMVVVNKQYHMVWPWPLAECHSMHIIYLRLVKKDKCLQKFLTGLAGLVYFLFKMVCQRLGA